MGHTYLALRMAIRHAIAHHLNRGGVVTDPEGLLETLGEGLLAWLETQPFARTEDLCRSIDEGRERMSRVEGHRNG